MAIELKTRQRPFFVTGEKKEELRRIAREVNARLGIYGEPTMTLEELHASQIAHGVRPEDCGASRELLRMRYPDEYGEE